MIYVFGLLPFNSSNWYTVQLRAAAHAPLLTLGFVAVYIAFSINPALNPLLSDAIGTILLILLVLEVENCFIPQAADTAVAQSQFSSVRLGIILLMLAGALSN